MSTSEARERVLQAAEALFVERGYEAVTVKDIAQAVGIHHASLYHHIPGGKAALYVEVMTRHMQRHQQGLRDALAAGGDDLGAQLRAIAAWLLAQPPVDVVRMASSDLPALPDAEAEALRGLVFTATIVPINIALEAAQARGEIYAANPGNIAGALFSAIQGLHSIPAVYLTESRQAMAEEIIDVMLRGLRVS